MKSNKIKIAIAGAGRGGLSLMEIFRQSAMIDIVGIADQNTLAPGIKLAKSNGIFTSAKISDLKKKSPDLVINVTRQPEITRQVIETFKAGTEVIEGSGALVFWQLINEREKALSYLKGVLHDSQDMIIATNMEGKITHFSKGGERILGYSIIDLTGRNVAELYKDTNERKTISQMLERSGALFNYETTLSKKDGSPAEISLTISKLYNSEGEFIGTVGISKDISLEKSLRKALKEKNEELEHLNEGLEEKISLRTRELEISNRELKKANELKGRFIANASHELRTPLNSIIGFSDILKEKIFGELNAEQEKYVSNIYASGNHLLHLVNNILDMAKIESGKAELDMEEVSLSYSIEEVESVLKALSDKKEIELINEIPENINVFADRTKLKQVFYNLISNAIKFTPSKGKVGVRIDKIKEGETSTWAPPNHSFLKISVWDTGIGIPHEDLSRIFDEFEQVDNSKSTEGTGLGLSLTKKLIELHGGHINVISAVEKGSVFSIYIPFIHAEEIQKKHDYVYEGFYPQKGSQEINEKPLVLVAEDDLATSEILTVYLTQAGYRVAHAYNGDEAIEKAKGEKPFAIALDIMLPQKDGWEVLQALKDDYETAHIPVIIHSIIENRELAFALGATDYLVKPASKETLLGKLDMLMPDHEKRSDNLTILAATGNSEFQNTLGMILSGHDFMLHFAADSQSCMDLALATRPNIILVDLEDETSGFELIERIKKHPMLKDTPVFAFTPTDSKDNQWGRLKETIEGVLTKKAIQSEELLLHLNKLKITYPQRAGLVDELTGLFNAGYMAIRYPQEAGRAERYKFQLALLFLHMDHFRTFRDKKGDYYANLALKKVAAILKKTLRSSDIPIRYDTDTFAIIITNTPFNSAVGLAQRLIEKIHDFPFLHEEIQPIGKITASIGISNIGNLNHDKAKELALLALEKAINTGGNKVEIAE